MCPSSPAIVVFGDLVCFVPTVVQCLTNVCHVPGTNQTFVLGRNEIRHILF